MYAYSKNNPVILADAGGTAAKVCIGAESNELALPWGLVGGGGGYSGKIVLPSVSETIDITNRLNQAMIEHAEELYSMAQTFGWMTAFVYFVDAVKFGGEWDLKHPDNWNLIPSVTYVYNGMKLRFDDVGNIHYGFVGRVLFGEEILRIGAGLNQIWDGTSSLSYIFSYFDDPRDQMAIGIGFRLWEEGLQWAE